MLDITAERESKGAGNISIPKLREIYLTLIDRKITGLSEYLNLVILQLIVITKFLLNYSFVVCQNSK